MKTSELIRRELVKLREVADLTVKDMAHSVGLSAAAWYRLEDGSRSPSVELLDKLQAVWGLELSLDRPLNEKNP